MGTLSTQSTMLQPMHMRADDDLLALTKLEMDKKKAAPADKENSAPAGCGHCHTTAAVAYAGFVHLDCCASPHRLTAWF